MSAGCPLLGEAEPPARSRRSQTQTESSRASCGPAGHPPFVGQVVIRELSIEEEVTKRSWEPTREPPAKRRRIACAALRHGEA